MLVRFSPVPEMEALDRVHLDDSVSELFSSSDTHDRVVRSRSHRLLVLAALNGIDLGTTAVLLALGGAEANPLLAPVMHLWWAPLATKVMVFALVLTALLRCPVHSRVADHMVSATCVFYIAVVTWNISIVIGH